MSVARTAVLWHLPLPLQMEQRISGWEPARLGGVARGFRGPGAITGDTSSVRWQRDQGHHHFPMTPNCGSFEFLGIPDQVS